MSTVKNMKVTVYHEIDANSLQTILKEGIKCASEGEKTKEKMIQKADAFLDTHRPEYAQKAGLSRSNNLYAYLSETNKIIDIADGEPLHLKKFLDRNNKTLVDLRVDPARCYVSDLDLYDTVKRSLELDEQNSTREHLAQQYWQKLIPLDAFENGVISRPEIMITYDIDPADIHVVAKKD